MSFTWTRGCGACSMRAQERRARSRTTRTTLIWESQVMTKLIALRTNMPRLLPLLSIVMICGAYLSLGAASGPSNVAQVPDFGDGGKADDAVKRAIFSGPQIPKTIFDVLRQLEGLGGTLKTHIVAN